MAPARSGAVRHLPAIPTRNPSAVPDTLFDKPSARFAALANSRSEVSLRHVANHV
jgi:hypothetical protein